MRTIFINKDSQPEAIIRSSIFLTLPIVDLSLELSKSSAEKQTEVTQEIILKENKKPFDLTKGPLIRAQLLKLSELKHILLIHMHHIVFDGWSTRVLQQEVIALYVAFASGQRSLLPNLPVQYTDFAIWQRQWLSGSVFEQQMSYWKQKLADLPSSLELPVKRPPFRTYESKNRTLHISEELTRALKTLSRQADVTLFMTLLATFQVLLFQHTQKTDIAIGTPIANRNRPEIESLIGFFSNTLVMRADLSGQPTFIDLLHRVKTTALDAYAYQDLPFEKIVEVLRPQRSLNYHPLFQVVFNFQKQPCFFQSENLQIKLLTSSYDTSRFDLGLNIFEKEDSLEAVFNYSIDPFTPDEIEKVVYQFQSLLEAFVAWPTRKITEKPRLDVSSRRLTCALIGTGNLFISCAEQMLQLDHIISVIVTNSQTVRDWSEARKIPVIPFSEALGGFLREYSFDYIFSIYSPYILSQEVLQMPHRGAVNLHDARLPKYGGLHAPSWALFYREATHGVTWHWMTEKIDEGQIIKQIVLPVSASETAFTLNAKCYEAALESFPQLLEDLMLNRVSAQCQDLEQRLYFNTVKRPTSGCVVDWSATAEDIEAYSRALDFQTYPNPFGLLKLYAGGKFFLTAKLEISPQVSEERPGTIIEVSDDHLRISTATQDIVVRSLQTLEGEALNCLDWSMHLGLQEGSQLAGLSSELSKRIEEIEISCLRQEPFWVERLEALEPIKLPIPEEYKATDTDEDSCPTKQLWEIPAAVCDLLAQNSEVGNRQEFLFVAFATYLARISQSCRFDLGLAYPPSKQWTASLNELFTTVVPCHLEIDCSDRLEVIFASVKQQLDRTRRSKTFHRDVAVRYPKLAVLKGTQKIERQFSTTVFFGKCLADYTSNATSAFEFAITQEGACAFFYDASCYSNRALLRESAKERRVLL